MASIHTNERCREVLHMVLHVHNTRVYLTVYISSHLQCINTSYIMYGQLLYCGCGQDQRLQLVFI